ncbi:MAG TPA: glycosyltransferase [Candidatus Pacearchaeota archaeon]|nr:glycosyltransferase [Candidatus Pacearchaeota archaeon]HPZ74538.1 glycosyltransferase [Candidatus Pacearchaeota archaeon]HQD89131.1 glycosyltransferase [Candidatus Pacearchaeota archaeon]
MKKNDLKVLYLSSFPPRQCGIADFTQNTINAVYKVNPNIDQKVIAINEKNAPKRDYLATVKWELEQEDLDSYQKTANYINECGADVLFLQHEYGLFGGFDGIFVLKLLEKLKVPIVSFYHTIPLIPTSKRREFRLNIIKNIGNISKHIITTTQSGKEILEKECKIPVRKISIVHHGGYDIPYPKQKDKEELKKKYGFQGKFIVLTYGLITKSKGIDYAIEAIAKLKDKHPNILYIIAGTSHPVKIKLAEKDYYSDLQLKTKKAKAADNVKFVNKYFEEEELIDYLKMADLFLIPYLVREQISSGVLANAATTGNCILSTPFPYAKEIIGEDEERGYFIDFENSDSIAQKIAFLIENPKIIEKKRKEMYQFGRNFTWQKMAEEFIKILQKK